MVAKYPTPSTNSMHRLMLMVPLKTKKRKQPRKKRIKRKRSKKRRN